MRTFMEVTIARSFLFRQYNNYRCIYFAFIYSEFRETRIFFIYVILKDDIDNGGSIF